MQINLKKEKRAERYANKLEKGKIPDVDKVLSQAK